MLALQVVRVTGKRLYELGMRSEHTDSLPLEVVPLQGANAHLKHLTNARELFEVVQMHSVLLQAPPTHLLLASQIAIIQLAREQAVRRDLRILILEHGDHVLEDGRLIRTVRLLGLGQTQRFVQHLETLLVRLLVLMVILKRVD